MFNGVEFGYDQVADIYTYDSYDTTPNHRNIYDLTNENDRLLEKLTELEQKRTARSHTFGQSYMCGKPPTHDQTPAYDRSSWRERRPFGIEYRHSDSCQCPKCCGDRRLSEQREIRRMLYELRDRNEKLTIFVVISLIFMTYCMIYRPNFNQNEPRASDIPPVEPPAPDIKN